MRSWVRYSVSAYVGMLLAGSIAGPGVYVPQPGGPMALVAPGASPAYPVRLYHQPAVVRPDDRSPADS